MIFIYFKALFLYLSKYQLRLYSDIFLLLYIPNQILRAQHVLSPNFLRGSREITTARQRASFCSFPFATPTWTRIWWKQTCSETRNWSDHYFSGPRNPFVKHVYNVLSFVTFISILRNVYYYRMLLIAPKTLSCLMNIVYIVSFLVISSQILFKSQRR
jgi:hypothetical protein